MTTHNLRRWGAVLLAGGLFLTAAYLIYPSSAHDALIRPAAGLGLIGVLLMLPGLVAFQVGQSGRARVTGWIGTALVVIGIASLEIPHLVKGLFDPSSLYDLDAYHASIFGAMEFYGIVSLAVGMIVLCVAIWRAGLYPRVAFWLMLANLVVSAAASSVPGVADAVHQPAPSYLLVALLGLVMRRTAERPETVVPGRLEPATSPAV
jgi:hypothetical protein